MATKQKRFKNCAMHKQVVMPARPAKRKIFQHLIAQSHYCACGGPLLCNNDRVWHANFAK